MPETVYNVAKAEFARADIDWESADIRSLLLRGTITQDPTNATLTDVFAETGNDELTDGSYARVALSSKTVTQDDGNNRANIDATTVDYGALNNETPTAILFYLHVGADSANIPISIHSSGFGAAANGAGYTVTTPNDILRFT
jgi:hypothetical protein